MSSNNFTQFITVSFLLTESNGSSSEHDDTSDDDSDDDVSIARRKRQFVNHNNTGALVRRHVSLGDVSPLPSHCCFHPPSLAGHVMRLCPCTGVIAITVWCSACHSHIYSCVISYSNLVVI